MKKHLLVLLSLFCATTMLFAERVSQSDAAIVASNFLNGAVTTSTAKKSKAVTPNRMTLKTAASSTASESQFYVYENPDGGWVMVSASDAAHPIIAYSPEGSFNADNQPDNVKNWLGKYEKQIQNAEANGVVATDDVAEEWRTLKNAVPRSATITVAPLIQTKWNQDEPYNNSCPSGTVTGCVATALAQVLNYWQWPKVGNGSHTIKNTSYSANFGETTYDWDNMLPYYNYIFDENDQTTSVSMGTTAQQAAVATLMYHCGVAVDMTYGSSSSAYTIDYNGYFTSEGTMCAETALTQFFKYKASTVVGYYRDGSSEDNMRSWTESEWIAMLKEELNNGRPIMYAGGDQAGESGHSFICDGYDSDNKFHFNWGWAGSCDGYYSVNSLIPGSGGIGSGDQGDYSYTQDVIVGIVPDKQPVDITWNIQGTETEETFYVGDKLTFNKPADVNGKSFVGWTTDSNFTGTDAQIAALITTSGSASVTESVTYYAVFATANDGGSGSAAYTFTTKDWTATLGGNAANWTSGQAGAGYSNNGVQVTANATGANATCQTSYSGITSIVVNYCTNAKAGDGTVTLNVNGTEVSATISSPSSNGTTPRDLTLDFSGTNPSGAPQITVACTKNSIYICGVTINYHDITYADYTLSPSTDAACELTSITLDTENVKKSFLVGSAFNYDNLQVIAHYSNCADKTKTPTSVSEPDMSSAGTKTITVTYTENNTTKTATYEITVANPIIVTWNDRGSTTTTEFESGAALILPANPANCSGEGGKNFVGWTESSSLDGSKPADLFIEAGDKTVTTNITYYAVFAKSSVSGNTTVEKTMTFSNEGLTNSASLDGTSLTMDNCTLTFAKNNANNPPAYYTSGTAIRFYFNNNSGNSLTVASDNIISSIVLDRPSAYQGTITADIDGLTDGTWTGSSKSVTFTWSAGGRLSAITVTTSGGSVSYSNYSLDCTGSSTPTCTLESIGVDHTNAAHEFNVGDAFSSDGIIVTAFYEGDGCNLNSKDVTASVTVTAPDMTTAGNKNVTVSYTEGGVTKTYSYGITVNAVISSTHTVTYYTCGEQFTTQTYDDGDALAFPATNPLPFNGKAFVGWTAEEHYTGATAPTLVTAGTVVNADANYYAVYK